MTRSHPLTRKPYVCFGPRTWALIRHRYLRGETARSLAGTFGCSVAVIRKRARGEGWTRRALALAVDALEPAPPALTVEAGAGPEPTRTPKPAGPPLDDMIVDMEPRAAARRALDHAMRMLLLGEMNKAVEAARIADLMTRTAERLALAEAPEAEPDDAAELEAVRRKVAAMIEAARAEGARGAEPGRG